MNIFLVEDERWALAELVELFKVYEPEHQVYAFDNGEDALVASKLNRPQLVVSDINMPGMDGLELIKALLLADRDIKGIILTGHDQFEYAQKGLKIGVMEYLLKPVKQDILYKSVNQAIHKIEQESMEREERMEGFITQMLFNSFPSTHDGALQINEFHYCIVLLQLINRNAFTGWKETGITNRDIKKHFICADTAVRHVHCIDIDSYRKVLLVPMLDQARGESAQIQSKLLALYRELNKDERMVNVAFVLKKAHESLQKSFIVLSKHLEDHCKFGAATLIAYDLKCGEMDFGTVWEQVRVLESQFIRGEILKGKETIQKIISELAKKEISMKQLQLFLNDLFYSLKYNVQSTGRMEIHMMNLQEDLKVVYEFSAYDQLSDWLEKKIWGLYHENVNQSIKPKELIPLVMQWIHSNYQYNISLQQFAADHHVSLGYLSRLFKVQGEETFSDYLIRYRIEKAKDLLLKGRVRLSDVSLMVGYEDAKHFSQLFKKIVGEPPIAYVKRNQNI